MIYSPHQKSKFFTKIFSLSIIFQSLILVGCRSQCETLSGAAHTGTIFTRLHAQLNDTLFLPSGKILPFIPLDTTTIALASTKRSERATLVPVAVRHAQLTISDTTATQTNDSELLISSTYRPTTTATKSSSAPWYFRAAKRLVVVVFLCFLLFGLRFLIRNQKL